ncbi:MAG: low molecular weight phosphotyrosine protein phosphatase [Cytophagales bacterium]|nr:low molecular weight phosphotyrosine protein phosphatase [Armatimonadota bacterium]
MASEPSQSTKSIHVLFVCLGNICRSPMAEAVLRHKVAEAGLSDRIRVDSAGTGDWHLGSPPHKGTRRILEEYGISSEGIAARQIIPSDLETFDYVLTMDDANLVAVRDLAATPRATVRPLLEFSPELGVAEVPDPYYKGGFSEVYDLIDAACDKLLATIRSEHHL